MSKISRLFRAESHKTGCNFLIKHEIVICGDGSMFERHTQDTSRTGKWEIFTGNVEISNQPTVYKYGDCMKVGSRIYKEYPNTLELPKYKVCK